MSFQSRAVCQNSANFILADLQSIRLKGRRNSTLLWEHFLLSYLRENQIQKKVLNLPFYTAYDVLKGEISELDRES